MSQSETNLTPYEARLVDLWERMVRTIGIHTVNVLVDRAIWEASQRHPALTLIEHDDNGLSFASLNKSIAGKPESETSEAFADLTTELLLILARLLGKEMAEKLAKELELKLANEKQAARRGGGQAPLEGVGHERGEK